MREGYLRRMVPILGFFGFEGVKVRFSPQSYLLFAGTWILAFF